MKRRKKTTTLSALWKYLRRDYLTPKEENKLSDLANNIKIIFYMFVILVVFIWVLNLSGCFESRISKEELIEISG